MAEPAWDGVLVKSVPILDGLLGIEKAADGRSSYSVYFTAKQNLWGTTCDSLLRAEYLYRLALARLNRNSDMDKTVLFMDEE